MHSVVFKNDAVGDLVQSLNAINNIINHNKLHTKHMGAYASRYN